MGMLLFALLFFGFIAIRVAAGVGDRGQEYLANCLGSLGIASLVAAMLIACCYVYEKWIRRP